MKVKIKQAKRYVISLSEQEVLHLLEKLNVYTITTSEESDEFCDSLAEELEELLTDTPVGSD